VLLRHYQQEVVDDCLAALNRHGNTVAVVPTGGGKTIILAALLGKVLKAGASKALVLQHRTELTTQNATKFRRVNPDVSFSVVDADRKDWRGQVIFGMEPTLRVGSNLERMPRVDIAAIDEAHHAAAGGYQRIIGKLRDVNPGVKLFGLTATPVRGDGKGLEPTFDNVGAQIRIGELISLGHLVRPRTFVVDLGIASELNQVRRTASDFDMDAVAAIMDKSPVTDAVIDHWKEKAEGRRTIVFCSTVEHAKHVADAFVQRGVTAATVYGDMPDHERKRTLAAFDRGDIQVVTNCMVLTEGYDSQPTSCVILLRPCLYKSTYIQCVGRGLRTVDPEVYPGVVKMDAVILDFGGASLIHGTIEQEIDLRSKPKGEVREGAPVKTCPSCHEEVPVGSRECPACGHEFPVAEKDQLSSFEMSEIDILGRSNFRWLDLFGDDMALMATGFQAWAGVFCDPYGRWHTVGGGKGMNPKRLGTGERVVALALGDDWMNERESEDAAHKTRRWLKLPATETQMQWLEGVVPSDPLGLSGGISRYHASCLISFKFAKEKIKRLVLQ
jgi:DNA repair protein RadD